VAAGCDERQNHVLPDRKVAHPRADLEDLAGGLVPEHERRVERHHGSAPGVQIGAADAAVADAHPHLAVEWRHDLHVVSHHERRTALDDECRPNPAHRTS